MSLYNVEIKGVVKISDIEKIRERLRKKLERDLSRPLNKKDIQGYLVGDDLTASLQKQHEEMIEWFIEELDGAFDTGDCEGSKVI